MTALSEALPRNEVRPVRGEKILRGLNRVLPLGRKYALLVRALSGRHGLRAIPFDKYQLLLPAAWTKSITSQLLGMRSAPEFELLRPFCALSPKGLLIDAGANLGAYTLLFRSACAAPIIAYEPQPLLFKLLSWNIAFNSLPDAEARNTACGAQRGKLPFWMGLNGSVVSSSTTAAGKPPCRNGVTALAWEQQALLAQQGGAVIDVPVTTLDEDLADGPPVAILKIDCEGFECQVLRGARALLQRHRPILFIEVHPEALQAFGDSTQAVLDLVSPSYQLEFWYFNIGRQASKLARSLARFRQPKGRRLANVAEMMAAAARTPGPAQIYFLGRPK